MDDLDPAALIDGLTAALRRLTAEIGADGALSLEIAVAVVLGLAVLAGWLLHVLWVALGARRAALVARAEAAEAEARGWRGEAARLARLLDEARAATAPDAAAIPPNGAGAASAPHAENGADPAPVAENRAAAAGNPGPQAKDGHDKPDRVG